MKPLFTIALFLILFSGSAQTVKLYTPEADASASINRELSLLRPKINTFLYRLAETGAHGVLNSTNFVRLIRRLIH